jgi:hypothetical protein
MLNPLIGLKTECPLQFANFCALYRELIKAKSKYLKWQIVNKKIQICQTTTMNVDAFIWTLSSGTETRVQCSDSLISDDLLHRYSLFCKHAEAIYGKMNDKIRTNIKPVVTGFSPLSSPAAHNSCAPHANYSDLCDHFALSRNRSNR